MRLAQATAMDRVRPCEGTVFAALKSVDGGIDMRLARNEFESVQLVVTPEKGRSLTGVRVTAGDLFTKRRFWIGPRHRFAATSVTCGVLGYVRTREPPQIWFYENGKRVKPEPGWWPDPVMDFTDRADVADGDLQGFWIRVKCPEGQPAGEYLGALTVTADGVKPRRIPFRIRVNGFTLPRTPAIPLAITFHPCLPSPPYEGQKVADCPDLVAIEKDPESPVNVWKRHEDEWTDFIADYFIMPDSLYIMKDLPRFRQLKRLKEQGRLGLFNLTYWVSMGGSPEAWRANMLVRARRAYEAAKAEGLLDHAYLYGCDEMPTNAFERIRKATVALKKEFPDVPLMTTAYDHTFGLKPDGLPDIDIQVPETRSYDVERADRARATGRKVWWYIACERPPYPGIYLESESIEARLLMGAMSVRMRPDGFLYYQTSRWNASRPLDGKPFTEWNPRSGLRFHAIGQLFYVGPDGIPVASQRAENFRDGLEDLAYAKLLRERLAEAPSAPWSRRAEELLAVPQDVMVSMTNYTHSAAAVYRWRDAMADLIEGKTER